MIPFFVSLVDTSGAKSPNQVFHLTLLPLGLSSDILYRAN